MIPSQFFERRAVGACTQRRIPACGAWVGKKHLSIALIQTSKLGEEQVFGISSQLCLGHSLIVTPAASKTILKGITFPICCIWSLSIKHKVLDSTPYIRHLEVRHYSPHPLGTHVLFSCTSIVFSISSEIINFFCEFHQNNSGIHILWRPTIALQ